MVFPQVRPYIPGRRTLCPSIPCPLRANRSASIGFFNICSWWESSVSAIVNLLVTVLRMSRAEIGSFLGLKIETVSRLFTRFQDQGLLAVRHKNVRITNSAGLEKMIGLRC